MGVSWLDSGLLWLGMDDININIALQNHFQQYHNIPYIVSYLGAPLTHLT